MRRHGQELVTVCVTINGGTNLPHVVVIPEPEVDSNCYILSKPVKMPNNSEALSENAFYEELIKKKSKQIKNRKKDI